LKAVSERLLALFERHAFDMLLVGRPSSEIKPWFMDELHPLLQERIGAWFDLEMFAPLDEITREIVLVEKHLKEDQERDVLDRLKDSLGPTKMGVTGLDDTLFLLQEGKLNKLIVKEGFRAGGRECPNCGYLDAMPAGGTCPACGNQMRPVEDVVDRAVRIAFDRHVKVHFVEGDEEFEQMGNIGGLLRFK